MSEWILSSCLLILAVILLRRVLRGRLNLRLQYALWLIVLLRLLLPFSMGSSVLSVQNWQKTQELTTPSTEIEIMATAPSVPQMELPQQTERPVVSQTTETAPTQTEAVPQTPLNSGVQQIPAISPSVVKEEKEVELTAVLKGIWIAGMLISSVVLMGSNLHFGHYLRKHRRPIQMGTALPLYYCPKLEMSCLFGFLKPSIYVNEAALLEEQSMRHVLEHEWTHYRQGDHIWSVLRCVCLVLHWYNPLVWWAAKLSKYDAELSCDEGTIRRIGEQERISYGKTLVDLACVGNSAKNLMVAATTMSGSKKSLKERILLLVKKPKMTVYSLVAAILATALAVGCTFTGPVELADSESETSSVLSEDELNDEQQELYRLVQELDALNIEYSAESVDDQKGKFLLWHLFDETYFDAEQWKNSKGLNSQYIIPAEQIQSIVKERTIWTEINLKNQVIGSYSSRSDLVYITELNEEQENNKQYALLSMDEAEGVTTLKVGICMEDALAEEAGNTVVETITAEFETADDSWRLLRLEKESNKVTKPYSEEFSYPEQVYLTTAEELLDLAERVNSGDESYKEIYWVLGSDIDMTGYEWQPIGGKKLDGSMSKFDGRFYGNGYTVKGISCVQDNSFGGVGFFGVLGQNALVYNLHVQGSFAGECNVGGIAGRAGGNEDAISTNISNCSFIGDVYAVAEAAGGIIGRSGENTAISRCFADANVYGFYDIGGLVGAANMGSLYSNCACTGTVTAQSLAQTIAQTGIEPVTYHADYYGSDYMSNHIGGFAGGTYGHDSFSYCIADVQVGCTIPVNLIHNFAGYYSNGKSEACYCVGDYADWGPGESYDGSNNFHVSEVSREELSSAELYQKLYIDTYEVWTISKEYAMPIPVVCDACMNNPYNAYRPYMEILIKSDMIYRQFHEDDMSVLYDNVFLHKLISAMGLTPDFVDVSNNYTYYEQDKVEEAVNTHFSVDIQQFRSKHYAYDEELQAYAANAGYGDSNGTFKIIAVQQEGDLLTILYSNYYRGGTVVIRLEEDGGWKYVSNSFNLQQQESMSQQDSMIYDAVLRFGAQVYTDASGSEYIQVDALSMYHNDSWTLESNTPQDMFAFFHGSKSMEGLSYEELREKYKHPETGNENWFYPQEIYEETLMSYFDVTEEFLRSAAELYSAEYEGYVMPSGGGVGFRPEIQIATSYTEGDIISVQLYLSTLSGETEPYILTLQTHDDGYRYLSYLPGSLD